MARSLFIKNIKTLITCDDQNAVLDDTGLYIEDGIIRSIDRQTHDADVVIDARHMLAYPGLINAHHHLYQLFTRNLPETQNLELFDWLKYLYEHWKAIDAEVVRLTSMVGMAELAKYGCTTVFDHHYVFPDHTDGRLIDAQFEAADQIGMRFVASRGSMDRSVKDGGLPPDSVVQTAEMILRDSRRVIEAYHDPSPYAMHQVVLAPCSPFSVSREIMVESAKLARSYGVRLHTHLAETRDEERYTMEKFGLRPLAYMDRLGWIGKDVWYAHGIHFNDEELAYLAETQTGVCHCPISNMKLSSGAARIPEMLELGIPVGLGVDGSASNDGSNLLEEVRMGYLLHRLTSSAHAPSGYDILKMATRGSAQLLGRRELGTIAVGAAADLFMIDSRNLELVGGTVDPKSLFGTIGYKRPVDWTIIDGRVIVKDGHLVQSDEQALAEWANIKFAKFISGTDRTV